MKKILLPLFLLALPQLMTAQSAMEDQILIDDGGRMYWRDSGKEVTGFGINYTVPFAYAYRNGKKLGVDLKAAIDQDIAQFKRLNLDLFRVHVWDCEISDTLGNLLTNDHLDLFDYLLFKLKENNINAVITPIAYWGNGWPEPDEKTPGFSSKYGKGNCLVNPDAIKAQENYLGQFVRHVNPYLGVAYKDDPSILAFEVCNEPHHEGTPEEVTDFVKKMKDAIRKTGCTKPVFYNVSHKVHLMEAYYKAGIDGGTFQWYPTGLGYQKELGGNMLPNVDRYEIPFDDVLKKYHSARFVYEFDAADMVKNYLYPAMARSFRTAGMQLATHFSYDPTFLAPYNTEYNTHYMNLLYAPQKALGLMICGEIFRTIPLYSDYGVYPHNTSFGPFKVDYERNQAEMVTDQKFIYTNHTNSTPPNPDKLELIAGWGNSPIVRYEGTGAYFLDKVGDEIWRLEIFPDAIQVNNLFGRNSLDKIVAVLKEERRKMTFNLPGFENGFSVESVDWRDSVIYRESKVKSVELKPGVYLLMSWKHLEEDSLELQSKYKVEMENFIPFPKQPDTFFIYHEPARVYYEGKDLKIKATITTPQKPTHVMLKYAYKDFQYTLSMDEKTPFSYERIVSAPQIETADTSLDYYFEVRTDEGRNGTFYSSLPPVTKHEMPAGNTPGLYHLPVFRANSISLFEAKRDFYRLNRNWIPRSDAFIKAENPSLYIELNSLAEVDNENQYATPIGDYSIRHFAGDLIKGREDDIHAMTRLHFTGHAEGQAAFPVQVALILKNGTAFGQIFEVTPFQHEYQIQLKDFKPVKTVLLPRPYPTFLPYFSSVESDGSLELNEVESLQISIGPGIVKEDWNKKYALRISGIWLE